MKQSKNFTLMELIIVMILTGLLIGVALPSFSKIATGQQLTLAGNEVAGEIAIARAYAIANHCDVALVFPTVAELQSDEADKTALRGYYNATCRAAIVTKKTNNEYHFVMWLPGSRWIRLPENTLFEEAGSDSDFDKWNSKLQGVYMGALMRLKETSNNASEDSGKTENLERYLVIQSNGQVVKPKAETGNGEYKFVLRLIEGSIKAGSDGKIQQNKRPSGEYAYLTLSVDTLNGRVNQNIDFE